MRVGVDSELLHLGFDHVGKMLYAMLSYTFKQPPTHTLTMKARCSFFFSFHGQNLIFSAF